MKPYKNPYMDAYYSTPAPVTYQTVRTIPRCEAKVESDGPVRIYKLGGEPVRESARLTSLRGFREVSR